MEEFKTNPESWKVEGNLIGEELGDLTTLSNFVNSHAAVDYDVDQTIGDYSVHMIKLTYVA